MKHPREYPLSDSWASPRVRKILVVVAIFAALVTMHGAFAITEHAYQKMQLSPYYLASIPANTNQSFTLEVPRPETGSYVVTSAIIYYDAYITPSVTYTAWVRGQSCINPTFSISTTFANAGRALLSFDCRNIIKQPGNYTITLRATQPTNAITSYAEITYSSLASALIDVMGTEYEPGDDGKIFTTLTFQGIAQNNATCYVEAFYPNSTEFIDYTAMVFLEDGIYYHDFTVPDTIGVYPVEVVCTYIAFTLHSNVTAADRQLGGGAGAIANLDEDDGSYFTMTETAGSARLMQAVFNFTGVSYNSTLYTVDTISVLFTGKRPKGATDPATDPVNFRLWNYQTGTFDLLGNDYSYSTTDEDRTYTVTLNPTYYINNSITILRINDTFNTSADGDLTTFSIDHLALQVSLLLTNTTVQTVAGGGELHITDYKTRILAAINAANFSTSNALVHALYNLTLQVNGTTTNIQQDTVELLTISNLLLNYSISTNTTMQDILLVVTNNSQYLCNATAITQNITQNITTTITEQANTPRTYTTESILLVVFIVLLVISLGARSTGFSVLTGVYGIFYGLFLMSTPLWWLGLIELGIGGVLAAVAWYEF